MPDTGTAVTEMIRAEKRDRVVLLTIERPEKKNALMDKMYRALAAEIRKADADDEVRALVITGVADSFTAGNDMVDFLNQKGTFETTGAHEFMIALYEFRKPALAAVNGLAIGVGVTLLMHCDVVYAAQSATFRMPFVSIGIAPEFCSTYLLPMMIGHARASELLLTGEKFDARKALECGIVNHVVADAEVLPQAMAKAKQLAEQPPATLRQCKKLLREAIREPAMAAFNREVTALNGMIRNNAEAIEAMTAFMQKRKPNFDKFR